MKKLLFPISIILCLVMILGSCTKELTGSNLDYVGTWASSTTVLLIRKDGTGIYNFNNGSSKKSVTGKVKISGSTLTIGTYFSKKSYTVTKPPAIEPITNIKNITLGEELFIKAD